MNLKPREKDKLQIAAAAIVARKRLDVKLNPPETVAPITDFAVEGACDGRPVAGVMEAGAYALIRDQVVPGIAEMIRDEPIR